MGKKGKKARAGKPTKKEIAKKLDNLANKLEKEIEGVDRFAPLPPAEDCPICYVSRGRNPAESFHLSCCGNTMCLSCFLETKSHIDEQNDENSTKSKPLIPHACPFCREAMPSLDDHLHRLEGRAAKNDPNACYSLGMTYSASDHELGIVKDDNKALDYYIRAAELGCVYACGTIASEYERNEKRKSFFNLVGALRGDVLARLEFGSHEYYDLGNYELGIRHWKIVAEGGMEIALNFLKDIYFANGKRPGKEFISEDDLVYVEQAYHDAQEAIKREERENYYEGKRRLMF